MDKILISYRRGDTRKESLHIYRILIHAFGTSNVFMDLSESFPIPSFSDKLKEALEVVRATIVVIGPDWLDIRDERGNRKIRNTNDILYIELDAVLNHQNIEVIPILLHNASMPKAEDLRIQMRGLTTKKPIIIREEPHFDTDIFQLIEYLRRFVEAA